MVNKATDEQPRRLRLESVVRWLATIATALFCGLSLVAAPFGCAVGEFEEDRNCATSVLSWASVGLLVLTIAVGGATHRRSVHWIGLALTLTVAYAGATQV